MMLSRLAGRFRRRRAVHFRTLLARVPRPMRILDVGGTEAYWRQVTLTEAVELEIVLLNLSLVQTTDPRFTSIAGDACDLSAFPDATFDIVFSNSVIEHVGDVVRQQQMAREIARVGRRYYVQTPNRRFPIEPHYLLPLFQFYPKWLKIFALRFFALQMSGGQLRRRQLDREQAAIEADSIRLLDRGELQKLFPGATIWAERLGPFSKSYVAYDGWA